MKKILTITFISILFVLFAGIVYYNQSKTDCYLSITFDTEDKSVPITEKMMNFYTYDLKSKELLNKAQIPFSSQYALGAVSLRNNKVFYTKREENELGNYDHLYSYDLTTKTEELLETENRAYNDIVPIGDKLLVSAIRKGNNPALFDLKNNKFEYLYENELYNEDMYICSPPVPFGYNINTDKFLYVYVDTEQLYNPEYRKGDPSQKTPIPHHISLIDSDLNLQNTYTFNNQQIQFATQIEDNKILCVTTEHPCATGKVSAYMLDMKKKRIEELNELPMPQMQTVLNCYTLDKGNSFYVFGRHIDGRSGVFYYDTKKNIIEEILIDTDIGKVINFTLLKY